MIVSNTYDTCDVLELPVRVTQTLKEPLRRVNLSQHRMKPSSGALHLTSAGGQTRRKVQEKGVHGAERGAQGQEQRRR